MAKVTSLSEDAIHDLVDPIIPLANCAVGPEAPELPTGKTVLWLDTSAGTSATFRIVTGD